MKLLLPKLSGTFLGTLSGTEMGFPLTIISSYVINDLSNENLLSNLTPEFYNLVLFNFLLGFATYKSDRYLDSIEYNKFINEQKLLNNVNYEKSKKHDYYLDIINNENIIQFTLFSSYLAIIFCSIYNNVPEIIPIFTLTLIYKHLKQLNIPLFKSLFISIMWTYCTCILPLEIYDKTLLTDSNLVSISSSIFLISFASTNLADIKDIEEDKDNSIITLPTIVGEKWTYLICLKCLLLSIYFF